MKRFLPAAFLVAAVLSAAPARADWPTDAGVDIPVANVDTSQTPSVIADDQGGAFVVFAHNDATKLKTLRGEHFDAQGNRLWSTAVDAGLYLGLDLLGLTLGTDNYSQALAFSDLDGGFIAAYSPGGSGVNYTLDLQRFDSAGVPVWTPNSTNGGVQLLATLDYYSYFYAVPDQLGGALLGYVGSSGFIGQRIDATGTPRYGNGYLLGDFGIAETSYGFPYLSGDGQGGLYYIYSPSGSESVSPALDYVRPSGTLGFNVPTIAPTLSYSSEWGSVGLADGGGAWAAWAQNGTNAIYLQELLADGGSAFPDSGAAGGLLVADTATYLITPELLNDGQGGVVVAWFDEPVGTNVIYVQHYAADGTPLWGAQPVAVSGAQSTPEAENGYLPTFQLLATPDNDVAVFWNATPTGIYAEKLDLATGTRLWGPLTGGVLVSSAASEYLAFMEATFASDDSAYVTYQEGDDVYLKHVRPDGTLGTTAVDAGMVQDGGLDGGEVDAGLDAGSAPDAGVDAGLDAGPDAGVPDAGETPDSGMSAPDSGLPVADAGPLAGPDAGPDAGPTPDAGPADAGVADGGGTALGTSGCGCSTAPDAPLWAMGLGLLWLTRPRRKQRR